MVSRLARTWLPALLLLGVLVAVARRAARPLTNPDTFFHLRFGSEFLSGWSLTDPGSVTPLATRDWVPTQWLPQVVMAWAEDLAGLPGVAWFAGLQLVLLLLALAWTCRRHADLLVVAVVVAVTVTACAPALSARPQVLSYAFMALTVHAWREAATTGARPWLLVPLTWFWAMWHGMWPFALVVGAVGVLAAVLHRRPPAREVRRQLAVLGSCALAAAVTPVGPALYPAVLTVAGRGRFFAEWAAPDFTSANGAALMLLAVPALLVWLRRGADWPRVLFLGLGLGLALYSNRTMPLAAVTLAPLAAAALQSLVPQPRRPTSRRELPLALGAAAGTLVVLALVVPHTADEPPTQPSWVDRELGALPAGTVVLNDWGDGGLVMWAYPQLHLVMHGYGDTFTTAELERNVDILDLERDWQDLVRGTGAEVAFLRTDHPLTAALEDAGWTIEETSEEVELLTAPSGWDEG
ncbi:hypothetical protein GCM10027270_07120 [Nocardioides ginkgobilobae]